MSENPFTMVAPKVEPNQYRMREVMIADRFESRMEDQARLGAMACPEQAITVIEDDPTAARRFMPHVVAGETQVHLAGRAAAQGAPV